MKILLQISFLLVAWFANLADATSVCVKVDVSSYKVSLTTLAINSDGVVDNLGRFALAAGKQFSKEALFIITKASTITNDVVDGAWKFYTTIAKNRVFAEINSNGDLIIKEFSNANFTGSSDDIVRSAHYTNPSGQIETADIAFVANASGTSGVTKKVVNGAGDLLSAFNTKTGINAIKAVDNNLLAKVKSWQGSGSYPGIDDWEIFEIPAGTKLYGGLPGQSEFYSVEQSLLDVNFNKANYWNSLQVSPHPQFGFRPKVGEYTVNSTIKVAVSKTLANTQHGSGGAWQVFVDGFANKVTFVKEIPLQ